MNKNVPSSESVEKFSRHALELFFDSELKNSTDKLGLASRHLECLSIRNKLLSLPGNSYQASVLAIKGILDVAMQSGPDQLKDASDELNQRREKAVKALYKLSETEINASAQGHTLQVPEI